MPKPKGYQVPQSERDKIAASHRRRNSMVAFAKNMTNAISKGDIMTAYEELDRYVAEQGHTLTDEEILAVVKELMSRLEDRDRAANALRPDGVYARMIGPNTSPVQKMLARQALHDWRDAQR